MQDAQDRVRQKVLPTFCEHFDSSLVGALCLLFDSGDDRDGGSHLGQSPDPFGSRNEGSVLCSFHCRDFSDSVKTIGTVNLFGLLCSLESVGRQQKPEQPSVSEGVQSGLRCSENAPQSRKYTPSSAILHFRKSCIFRDLQNLSSPVDFTHHDIQ